MLAFWREAAVGRGRGHRLDAQEAESPTESKRRARDGHGSSVGKFTIYMPR
jgi:hypothetical protein